MKKIWYMITVFIFSLISFSNHPFAITVEERIQIKSDMAINAIKKQRMINGWSENGNEIVDIRSVPINFNSAYINIFRVVDKQFENTPPPVAIKLVKGIARLHSLKVKSVDIIRDPVNKRAVYAVYVEFYSKSVNIYNASD